MNTLKFARELARFEEHPDWLIHGGAACRTAGPSGAGQLKGSTTTKIVTALPAIPSGSVQRRS